VSRGFDARHLVRSTVAADPYPTTTRRSPLGAQGARSIARSKGASAPHLWVTVGMRSLPDGPPAFLKVLNVIVWIVWACFAVDYVARPGLRPVPAIHQGGRLVSRGTLRG